MTQRFSDTRAFAVTSFKALDNDKGVFEALVSVFGNVDRGGDRVVKGAFAKSLTKWQESGDPIPVIWNHMWDNPEAHIGAVEPGDATETDDGLLVKGRIDLDNPFAKQVYRLLSERRVKEFSFGYDVKDAEKKDGALELRELELFEVGPTLKGMNPETELLAVKSLAVATSPDSLALVEDKKGELLMPEVLAAAAKVNVDELAAVGASGISSMTTVGPFLKVPTTDVKAGARLSKETLASLRRIRDEVDALISAGSPTDETPKSIEAEASGKASDLDADLRTQLQLLKENTR